MSSSLLSICIPSKNEIFLKKTIEDVLEKSTGNIEIFPVCQGYMPPDEEIVRDERVKYIYMPAEKFSTKRQAINKVVREEAKGEIVCWLDGHVMVERGWDQIMIRDLEVCGDKTVLVPRRKRLDPWNWTEQIQDHRKPHIDYEHFLVDGVFKNHSLNGFRWDQLSIDRKDILIDNIMTAQGSFFLMKKDWYLECGFFTDLRYMGFGCEAEEIVMGSLFHGGKSCVTKNTAYYHWHKSGQRGYHLSREELRRSYAYAFNLWVRERKDFFIDHLKKFPLQPHWQENWEELIKNM